MLARTVDELGAAVRMTALERFVGKTAVSDTCWNWTGATNSAGYGVFWLHGKNAYAHRVSFVLRGITIPQNHDVDHKCRNRKCVNPEHLRIVTHRVNSIENSIGPTAINAAKTHCHRGHELVAGNVKIYHGKNYTSRSCRKCLRLLDAKRRPWRYLNADALIAELSKETP